jgi:hypothetical protein
MGSVTRRALVAITTAILLIGSVALPTSAASPDTGSARPSASPDTKPGTPGASPDTKTGTLGASPNTTGPTAREKAATAAKGTDASAAAAYVPTRDPSPDGVVLYTPFSRFRLGVNPEGNINVQSNGSWVGLAGDSQVTNPSSLDVLAPGCQCEGWGIADTSTSVSGWASWDDGGTSTNMTVKSWQNDGSDHPQSATSVVDVADSGTSTPFFTVTHAFHAINQTTFQIDVTVKNTATSTERAVYRRVMDWDASPTPFSEYVTAMKRPVDGDASQIDTTVLNMSNDGFSSANPLIVQPSGGVSLISGEFQDNAGRGPLDDGALFDFDLGLLAPGGQTAFTLFYGMQNGRQNALDYLKSQAVSAYSIAVPSDSNSNGSYSDHAQGLPFTYFFGYRQSHWADADTNWVTLPKAAGKHVEVKYHPDGLVSPTLQTLTKHSVIAAEIAREIQVRGDAALQNYTDLLNAAGFTGWAPPDTVTIEIRTDLCYGLSGTVLQVCGNSSGYTPAPGLVLLQQSNYEEWFRDWARTWIPGDAALPVLANIWSTTIDHEFWHIVQDGLWAWPQIGLDYKVSSGTLIESSATAAMDLFTGPGEWDSYRGTDFGTYWQATQDLLNGYSLAHIDTESPLVGGTSYDSGAILQYFAERLAKSTIVSTNKQSLAKLLAAIAAELNSPTPLGRVSAAINPPSGPPKANVEDWLRDFYVTALLDSCWNGSCEYKSQDGLSDLNIRGGSNGDLLTTQSATVTRTIEDTQGEVLLYAVPTGNTWVSVRISSAGHPIAEDAHVALVPIRWDRTGSHVDGFAGTPTNYVITTTDLGGTGITRVVRPTDPSATNNALAVVLVAGDGINTIGRTTYDITVTSGTTAPPPGPKPLVAKKSAKLTSMAQGAPGLSFSVTPRGDAGMPFGITGTVSDDSRAITNSQVVAAITDPSGKVRRFAIPDDGMADDPSQDDGTYGANVWGTGLAGTYQVDLTATGTDNHSQPFTLTSSTSVTLAAGVDSDNDGITNQAEAYLGTNPLDPSDGATDADGDGLTLAQELAAGTNPTSPDTDGGGEADGSEVARGLDPLSPNDDAALGSLGIAPVPADGGIVKVNLATSATSGQIIIHRTDSNGTVVTSSVAVGTTVQQDGPLPAGVYTYDATLVGSNGAVGPVVKVAPITVADDVTPPDFVVTLDGGTVQTQLDHADVWVTSSSEPLAGMRIAESADALAQATWLPYQEHSTFDLSAGLGNHDIYVEVRDAAGNTATQYRSIGRVAFDTTPPVSSVNALPANVGSRTLSVAYTASDNDSVAQVYLWKRFKSPPDTTFGPWTIIGAVASPVQVDLAQGDGTYEFYTTAVDASGNAEAAPAVADASVVFAPPPGTEPITRVNPLPPTWNGDDWFIPMSYTATDNGNGISQVDIWCRYQAFGSAAWSTWQVCYQNAPSASFNMSLSNMDGRYEFYSIGIDNADQHEAAPVVADASTMYDRYAPSTNTFLLPAKVSSTTLRVPFASSDGGGSGITSVELWEGGPLHDYQLVASGTTSPFTISLDQGPGEYAFYTIGTDLAGNREWVPCCEGLWWGTKPDARTILDQTAPVLESQVLPLQNPEVISGSISLQYTAAYPSGTGSVELWQRFEPAGSDSFGAWSKKLTTDTWPIPLNLELEGRYEFYTIAVDSLGASEDPPATADATVLLDHTPPTSTVGALPTTVSTTPYDIQCQASDAGSGAVSVGVWWRWIGHEADPWPDWNSAGNCQPGGALSFDFWKGEGYYQFASSAVDAIGNAEPWPTEPEASTYFGPLPESHVVYAPVGQRPGVLYLSVESNMPYELWERYAPNGSTNFTAWAMVGSAAQGDEVPFTIGPEGKYEFYSIAVSASGARELPPDTADAVVIGDSTRPTSSAGPIAARTSSSTITIPFTTSDGLGSGVEAIDVWSRYRANQDAAWSSWQIPAMVFAPATSADVTLTQGEGFYEFATTVSDYAGNYQAGSPQTSAATHYTTGNDPSSSVVGAPAATNQASATVPYTAEFASGSGSVELWERLAPNGPWTKVATATAPGTLTAPLAQGEGTYQLYTIAVDTVAGTREAAPDLPDASIIRDTTAPASATSPATIATSEKNSFSLYADSSDSSSGVANVELWWRYAPPASSTFTVWKLADTQPYGNFTLAFDSGDGTYQFYSIAIDAAGNREAPPATADTVLTLDTVAPTSTAGPLAAAVKSRSISIPYTASDNANGTGLQGVYLYRRFQAAGSTTWSDWTSVTSATTSPIAMTLPSNDGRYEFYTAAYDQAGNWETAPAVADCWTVLDRTAPVTATGAMPARVNVKAQNVPFTASDANGSGVASLQLQDRFKAAGGTSFGSWTTVATVTNPAASGTIPITLGSDGSYEFRTLGTDVAGNAEAAPASADASTILDSTPPVSSAGALPATTTASSISVAYTATDTNGSGVTSVELWQRFQPAGGSMGAWALLATGTASPFTVATTADGRYEFYTVGIDLVGNREAAPASADAFTVRDTTVPLTVAGPLARAVHSTALSVPYTVTGGAVSSVELWQRCQPAGSTTWSAWAKVATVTSSASSGTFSVTLSSGPGRCEFYSIGVSPSGGREAAPASADAFTVLDTTAPTSAAGSLTTPRTGTSVSVTYTASDNTNGSGLSSVELWQRFEAAGSTTFSAWAKVATATASPIAVTLGSGDGRYEFYTIAVDAAGNREAAPSVADAFTVLDTTAPVSAASTLAGGTKTTALSVPYTATDTGGTGVASVELWQRFEAAGGTTFTTWAKLTTATTSPISVTLSSGAGRYEFYTIGIDAAGNREAAPASADTFTVLDTTAPTSAAGALPAVVNATALSVPYTAADNTGGSGLSKVDLYQRYEVAGSTTWSAWTKVATATSSATSGTFAVTLSSGAGTYQFYTIATDAATNAEAAPSAADASTVLDSTAPTSTITAPPSTSSAASISIAYTASDNTNGSGLASVEFWYRYKTGDGATPGAWTSGGTSATASGSFTLTFGSGAGIYDVLTVAVDKAGNREGAAANPPASTVTPKSSVRSISWAAGAKVNTDTGTALQDNASFVVGSDGTVYAVWEDSRNGNTDIYFSSRNPTTGVWAAETRLNSDTGTTGQRTPSIAIDGSGNLYVVWADDRNGSTNTDIYFAKRTGTTWSANIKVNSDTATAIQSSPRISVSSAGIAVAVWYDARSSQVNIYSARLPSGSTTWSTNYNITTSNTSAVKAAPDVAVASDGTAWAAWQDNRTGGGDIYTASLGPTATAWSTNTKVSDDSGASSLDKSPRIGLTSANSPVVAYLDGRSTNAAVRVVNRNGTTWNASVQVSDSSAKPATGLALAVKADGGVIVGWDDTRSTSAIWGAQCEAGSGTSSVTRCGPAEKWSDQTGASYRPTLFASTTRVYLGWRDDTAGGGDIRIRLRTPS